MMPDPRRRRLRYWVSRAVERGLLVAAAATSFVLLMIVAFGEM